MPGISNYNYSNYGAPAPTAAPVTDPSQSQEAFNAFTAFAAQPAPTLYPQPAPTAAPVPTAAPRLSYADRVAQTFGELNAGNPPSTYDGAAALGQFVQAHQDAVNNAPANLAQQLQQYGGQFSVGGYGGNTQQFFNDFGQQLANLGITDLSQIGVGTVPTYQYLGARQEQTGWVQGPDGLVATFRDVVTLPDGTTRELTPQELAGRISRGEDNGFYVPIQTGTTQGVVNTLSGQNIVPMERLLYSATAGTNGAYGPEGTFGYGSNTGFRVNIGPDGRPVFSSDYRTGGGSFFDDLKELAQTPVGALILGVATGGLAAPLGGALGLGTGALGTAVGGGLVGAGTQSLLGGDPLTGLLTGGLGGAFTGGLGNTISSGVSGALTDAGLSQALSDFAGGAISNATRAGLTSAVGGGDIEQALLNSLVSSGVSGGLGQIDGFSSLPVSVQNALIAGGSSGLLGGDALQSALYAGAGTLGQQAGSTLKDYLAQTGTTPFNGSSFSEGLDPYDFESGYFPPQEGDTFTGGYIDPNVGSYQDLQQQLQQLLANGDNMTDEQYAQANSLANQLELMNTPSPFINGINPQTGLPTTTITSPDGPGYPVTITGGVSMPSYTDVGGIASPTAPASSFVVMPDGTIQATPTATSEDLGDRYVTPVVASDYQPPLSPLQEMGEIQRDPVFPVVAPDYEEPLSPLEDVGEISTPPVTPVTATPPTGGTGGTGGTAPRPSGLGGLLALGGGAGGSPFVINPADFTNPNAAAGDQKSAFDAVRATAALSSALQQAYQQLAGIDPGLYELLTGRNPEEQPSEGGAEEIAESEEPQEYARGGDVHAPVFAAQGGALSQVNHKGSHYVEGEGGGQDDLVEAMLADGEYVFDADIVAALGDGSNKEGARKLDEMREAIRKHKRSAPHDKIPPKAKAPLSYLRGVK